MTVLQGDPFNLQGSAPAIQGGAPAATLQPASSPLPAPTSPAPTTSTYFYKPNPNSPQVYDAKGTPLSYDQYIAAGGKTDFSNVLNQSVPGLQPTSNPAPAQAPTFRQTSSAYFYKPDPNSQQVYDANGNPLSYEQYIAAGGLPNFSNVLNQPVPNRSQSIPVSPQTTAPTQPTDPNQALAQQAAKAGLSLDDYLKLASPTVSPEEKQAIYDKLGINQLEQDVFSPPAKGTEQLYNDAYIQAGLADVKAKIQTLFDQINKAQSDFTDASGVVNENPFLSEASRVGRISRLNDKAQAQIGNLTNQLSQLQDLYNNGVTEVNNLVTRSTADFQQNQSLSAQKLQYLLQKAEGQVKDLQTSKSTTALQYLPDYLKAKAAATKPDTIGSAESGYYRWNPDTGTFEQVIAPSITPNYQANPLTGDLFNTKTGQSLGSSGSTGGGFPAGAQTPGSAAAVNNPLGIKPNGKFAQYTTPDEGFQAGVDLIQKYQTNGPAGMNANSTLNQMVNTWITGNPNNTNKTGYSAANVAQYLQQLGVQGVTPNTPIGQIDSTALAAAIAHFETGYTAGSNLGNDTIGTLAQGVLDNPQTYSNLTSQQQAAVNARLAQAGIPLPTNTKPPSDTQNQAATYATRVQQAGSLIDNIQDKIASMNPISFEAQSHLPSYLQSADFQAYDQAARNLVNAILRRESGAAISTGEFNNAYMQYLPRAGDAPQTLSQKKQNRDAILNGLVQSAGPAYKSGTTTTNPQSNVNLSDLNFSF